MGRWLLVFLLTSAAAAAKDEPGASAAPVPGQTQALENALRGLNLYDFNAGTARKQQTLIIQTEVVGPSCGHIRVVPVNPDIDRGIIVGIPDGRRPDAPPSRMPVHKGLPPCETARR